MIIAKMQIDNVIDNAINTINEITQIVIFIDKSINKIKLYISNLKSIESNIQDIENIKVIVSNYKNIVYDIKQKSYDLTSKYQHEYIKNLYNNILQYLSHINENYNELQNELNDAQNVDVEKVITISEDYILGLFNHLKYLLDCLKQIKQLIEIIQNIYYIENITDQLVLKELIDKIKLEINLILQKIDNIKIFNNNLSYVKKLLEDAIQIIQAAYIVSQDILKKSEKEKINSELALKDIELYLCNFQK